MAAETSALGDALRGAVRSGDIRYLKSILNSIHRTDVLLERDDNGRMALHIAAHKGDTEAVRLLLRAGADIEALSRHGYTPLLLAGGRGRLDVAQLLLRAGANVNAQLPLDLDDNDAGMTALHRAAANKSRLDMLCLLLDYHPDLGIKSHNGRTALHIAVKEGSTNAVEYISAVCPREVIRATDQRGWQALHLAAKYGKEESVEILMERGAEANCVTRARWWTPLHLAAENGHERVVRLLLRYGADEKAATKDGDTAISIAKKMRHAEVLQILEDARTRGSTLRIIPRSMYGSTHSQERLAPVASDPVQRPRSAPGIAGSSSGNQFRSSADTSSGSFEARLANITSSEPVSQPQTFRYLDNIWEAYFEPMDSDPPVRVAILDTGIDLQHSDFSRPRASSFHNSKPIAAEREPIQKTRIKGRKNFCEPLNNELDVQDTNGHGTQVAGIILRLAPRAELLIAKVCGDDASGPSAKTVANAINWAVDKKADLINMSFGFSDVTGDVREVQSALKRAQNVSPKGAVAFAAMRNDGMLETAAWPARENSNAIGIHSCNDFGEKSDFTPRPVFANENFSTIGEKIPVHQLQSKGGGFCLASGTSFATPVAVSMAALVMSFVMERRAQEESPGIETHVLNSLWETGGMRRALRGVSEPTSNGYSWIHPRLFWKDYSDWRGDARQHAWRSLQGALLS